MKDAGRPGISVDKRSAATDRRVAVAPMMDWTDRHCRFFLRQFSPRIRLYTEMIHAAAILRGDAGRLLRFSPQERPLALQLGGSDPGALAEAARRAQDMGYDEVNLNCGCPSDRVRSGSFGACLMLRPALVAECVAAMTQAVKVPVTVKFRIGVVEQEAEGGSAQAKARGQEFDAHDAAVLENFARSVLSVGADALVVHARKAVLGGLSPHENRTVPPLRHDTVAQLRATLAGGEGGAKVPVIVNGGLRTSAEVLSALQKFDGVMIGREAYHRPVLLSELQLALYPDEPPPPGPGEVLAAMQDYATREVATGTPLHAITRHMLGMLSGRPGARALRQVLSADVVKGTLVSEVFRRAMALAQAAGTDSGQALPEQDLRAGC